MHKTYSLARIKTIRSHAGLARFLAECDCADDGDLIGAGYLARVQVEDIPSPYAYSPVVCIYTWNGRKIVWFETSHKVYEVFAVHATLLRFATDAEATEWHIRFARRPRVA